MQWAEEGIVLAARRHGESAAVVTLLTRGHGRHGGLVRGAARRGGAVQPGNRVQATWRARLADHLGSFTLEPISSGLGAIIEDRRRLAALAAACAVAEVALPERHPYPRLFEALASLLATLAADPAWEPAVVRWELALLEELGFGLDLATCAVTGTREGLAYVSPRTGRAVSAAAAGPYRDKLFPLPSFLIGAAPVDAEAIAQGLRLTGHFLEHHALLPQGRKMPPARHRLLRMFPLATPRAGIVRSGEDL